MLNAELTAEQIKELNKILRNTPIGALPHLWFEEVRTFEDVTQNLQSIVADLKRQYDQVAHLKARINAIEDDFAAAGRIFRRIGGS